ncbi:MAG: acyltransferase family protein [Pseudomonadota bacterium]
MIKRTFKNLDGKKRKDDGVSIGTKKIHLSHPKYRPDIDGLRAVAVLSVVAFHAFPSWIKGGFIGVDIFFFISGYLISTIIFENLDRGTFSFSEFYARRIKRIFPALLLVLISCFAFGWFALLADEYKQLGRHIAAGAGFISNFILWNESGYFDNSAESKPLLHLWSLGIEEQFYIVWPLLLWFARKRKLNLLIITFVIAIASFLLNIKVIKHDMVATFYSPQTRFWELLSGSLLAWVTLYKKDAFSNFKCKVDYCLSRIVYSEKQEADCKILSNVISVFGLLLLVYGFWTINKELSFPGKWALVPVLGAVLIITAGSKSWVNRILLSNKVAVWIGLISYPLYLWHWPILSFARIIEGEAPSRNIRIAAVILSIVLAWLTYKLVERPFRFGKYSKTKVTILVFLMAIVGFVGYNTFERDGLMFRVVQKNNSFTKNLGWRFWDNESCSKKFNISPCQISNQKIRLMIFGDSHGNHLYPGLVSALPDNVGVFSGGTCTPLREITLYVSKNQKSHPCASIDYLSMNFNILDSNPTVEAILISTFLRPVLTPDIKERDFYGAMRLESKLSTEKKLPPEELVYMGLNRTINDILNRKKEVVLVRDTPDFEKDIRDECLRRFSFSNSQVCGLPRAKFDQQRGIENTLIDKLKLDFPGLRVFDPFDVLCSQSECYLIRNNMPLYRDQHHLSVYGSELLGKAIVDKYFVNLKK